ncbi:MAG TPA: SusC/RagA family TonB-linked outer membrane protein [Gemmatimonadota bacterium]
MQRRLLIFAGLALVLWAPTLSAQRQVSGRVVVERTGEPLGGAEVYIEGTQLGVLADGNGDFVISVPEGPVELRANFLGYKSESETVPADQNTVTIAMEEDVLQLEGVIVSGIAATVQRRNAANAVGVVPDTLINRVAAQTVENQLQGKVPGLVVSTNSGAPGGGAQVQLRGVTSINADVDPLYVVDGVLMSNQAIQSGADAITDATGGGSGDPQDNPVNRIADLNPADIERVEILKGPSAAAIYGGKAAGGVIVITTKRGNEGKPRFNVSGRLGSSYDAEKLGTRSFETVEEAIAQFGPNNGATAAAFNSGGTHDYEDILYGQNDLSFETSANLSGGTEATRYYAAGLIKSDEGIMQGTGYDKQSLRLNLDQRVGSSLGFNVSSNLIHSKAGRALSNNDNTGTSFYMVLPFTPNFADLEPDAAGNYPDNPFERSNPVQTRDLLTNDEEVFRFIGSLRGTYDLIASGRHNLQIIGDVGADFFSQDDKLVFPPDLEFEPQDGLPGTSVLTEGDNTNFNTSGNLAWTYSPEGGAFGSTFTSGLQYSESDLDLTRTTTRDLIPGQGNVDQGSSVDVDQDRQRIEELGIYGQEELLLLQERLLLTAGLRADRSSANGDDDKFFVYPKASASYRFHDLASWLSEFKLRGAFGQTGNRPLFGQKFTPESSDNIDGETGTSIDEDVIAGDPQIEPERQSEVELGFDATMLNERATLEFSVYQKTVTDLLLERTLPPSSGFDTQIFNGGELRNRGVEVALSLTPLLSKRVNWLFRTIFYHNESEITDLPVPAFEARGFATSLGSFRIEEGESATQIVGNAGVDADGIPIVVKLGDAAPDFTWSFTNDLTFDNVNLYFLLDWKKGGDIINLTNFLYDAGGNSADYELADGESCPAPEDVDSDSPGVCRLGVFGTWTRPLVESGSFLKLRELSLSYDIAPALGQNGFFGQQVSYLRVGVSGRNLLTSTPYNGLDPEVSNFGNQPIGRNIDVAPFPPSRSFWLTVDVGF